MDNDLRWAHQTGGVNDPPYLISATMISPLVDDAAFPADIGDIQTLSTLHTPNYTERVTLVLKMEPLVLPPLSWKIWT